MWCFGSMSRIDFIAAIGAGIGFLIWVGVVVSDFDWRDALMWVELPLCTICGLGGAVSGALLLGLCCQ
jgi:hypothetical protein